MGTAVVNSDGNASTGDDAQQKQRWELGDGTDSGQDTKNQGTGKNVAVADSVRGFRSLSRRR
jgi:hypothetical protein